MRHLSENECGIFVGTLMPWGFWGTSGLLVGGIEIAYSCSCELNCTLLIVYCWRNILLPCHVLNYHIKAAINRLKHRYLCNKLHGSSSDGWFIEGIVCMLQLSLFFPGKKIHL